jgi:formate--tetrahydrofolate ligase
MKTDLQIAQEAQPAYIEKIAGSIGLERNDIIPYGSYKAKINTRSVLIDTKKKIRQPY